MPLTCATSKTTAGHIGRPPGSSQVSLTGHWIANSVGLRGFVPLLLPGKRTLGDCDAQVRFQERTEDAARFARRAHRTLSSAEASLLPGVDRGKTLDGIAATLRRAVLPARARVPRKPEAARDSLKRRLANAGERKSRGRD